VIDSRGLPESVDVYEMERNGRRMSRGMGSDKLDGVMEISRAGKLAGRIALPERCANLCFSEWARNRLFMASSHSIYVVHVIAHGVLGRQGTKCARLSPLSQARDIPLGMNVAI
jgi:gluconolactonase